MKPKTQRGWVQLGMGLTLVVLLSLAAANWNRTAALGAIPFLGAAAMVFGGGDRDSQRSFAESVRASRIASRLKITPAKAYFGIFLGTLVVLLIVRLVFWLAGE